MNKVVCKNLETGAFPSVIHANGISHVPGKWDLKAKQRGEQEVKDYACWPRILNLLNAVDDGVKPMRDDLTIVTWKGGKYTGQDTPLEISCRQFGVDLMILPWPSHISSFWEASKAKVYETLSVIKSGKINTKYMMALDCGDVVFLKHPNEVLEDYLQMFKDYKSVWCTEANDWPRPDLPKYVSYPVLDDLITSVSKKDRDRINEHNSRFAYINVGCAIGETQSFEEFYQTSYDICKDLTTNDQAMGRISQYLLQDNHIGDYECKIFQCLYDVSMSSLDLSLE